MDRFQAPTGTPTGVAGVSALSWGAIIAGAAVAAAASLVLFALASGLDLASFSVWPRRSVSASVSTVAALALIATQWISASLGGYITGRLRTSWVGTHTHEVFFRDTAHGFISWCVTTVLLASGLLSPAATFTGVSVRAAPALRTPSGYLSSEMRHEQMLQPSGPETGTQGDLVLPATPPAADVAGSAHAHFIQLIAGRSADTCTQPGVAIDDPADARGATAAVATGAAAHSILTALSTLVGAFIASVSAALGGKLRDLHP